MHEWEGVLPLKKMARHIGHLSPHGRDKLGEGAAHRAQPGQGSLTRCQKSPSPRSSFPHRDPLRRWRSNSRRGSSGGTEGRRATTAGGARGQRLGGLTMVDTSPGAAPREPGSPATPAGGRRQRARPWRPQRFAAPRSGAEPRRRGRLRALRGTRPVAEAVLLSGARRRSGGGSRRGAAERWLREAARSRRGAAHHLPPGRRLPARRAWSALRGSLRRAPAGGRRQGARRASEPEGTVRSGGEEDRDRRSSAARSSRPREGSREGGGGSAHAARSFRRSNRGRPRERQAK